MEKAKFPESWSALRHKEQRYYAYLTIVDLLKLREKQVHLESKDLIDEIYHQFYDDTDLCTNPQSELKYTLIDLQEVEAFQNLSVLLDRLINELGDATTNEYVSNGLWPKVERASLEIRRLFLKRGLPLDHIGEGHPAR